MYQLHPEDLRPAVPHPAVLHPAVLRPAALRPEVLHLEVPDPQRSSHRGRRKELSWTIRILR